VFVELARQARALADHPVLAGWLYTTASRMAANHSRGRFRRQLREQTLMQPEATPPTPEINWEKLKPVLDDVMKQLPEADRQAVVLRFLEGRDFRSIGAELGLGADAARMRVSRALVKLHSSLAARGLVATTAAFETLLAQQRTVAVPACLAARIAAGVRQVPLATVAAPAFGWTARKLVVAAVVGLVGGGAVMIAVQRHRDRTFLTSPADEARRQANADANEKVRPRWMRRAGSSPERTATIDPRVAEALGYLRSALFEVSLDQAERLRLLAHGAGLLVGNEDAAIPLFREAFASTDHGTVAMAIESIARFGRFFSKNFAPELLALLEDPAYSGEAGLIANRLVFALWEGESPVPELLALLQRRPDLHEQLEYLLTATIGTRPKSLTENHELLEALARESTGDIQAAALKVLGQIPPAPAPPSPEVSGKIVAQLRSATGTTRWDGLMAYAVIPGSDPEIRQALADVMQRDPFPANRLEARLALMQKAPDDPALATPAEAAPVETLGMFEDRLARNDVPVAELLDALADRPESAAAVCRAMGQVPESYWMEHVQEKVQALGLLSSLHRCPDARVYEAAADLLGAFNHAPRQYYTVEELAPFFKAMETGLTPGEYAIAVRDNDFAGYWKNMGFKQPEPTHLRTMQVQTLLVGPSFQNPPAYELMLKAMLAIDPRFEPPKP
jgi:RNA polymerase sigma factor (sigma-70 family)